MGKKTKEQTNPMNVTLNFFLFFLPKLKSSFHRNNFCFDAENMFIAIVLVKIFLFIALCLNVFLVLILILSKYKKQIVGLSVANVY